MIYLIAQMILALALAVVMGGALGWLIHRASHTRQLSQLKHALGRSHSQLAQAQSEIGMLTDDYDELLQRSNDELDMLRLENQQIPNLQTNLEKSQLLVRQMMQKHEAKLRDLTSENHSLTAKLKQVEEREQIYKKVKAELEQVKRQAIESKSQHKTNDPAAPGDSSAVANDADTTSTLEAPTPTALSVSKASPRSPTSSTPPTSSTSPTSSALSSPRISNARSAGSWASAPIVSAEEKTQSPVLDTAEKHDVYAPLSEVENHEVDSRHNEAENHDGDRAHDAAASYDTDATDSEAEKHDADTPLYEAEKRNADAPYFEAEKRGTDGIHDNAQSGAVVTDHVTHATTEEDAVETTNEVISLSAESSEESDEHESDPMDNVMVVDSKLQEELDSDSDDDWMLDGSADNSYLFEPVEHRDDLKQLFGIGPVTEKALNELGITSYSQLAYLKKHEIEKIASALQIVPGRIERDDWVGNARRQLEDVLEQL